MKKLFCLLALPMLFLGGISNTANASCWCHLEYCIGNAMTVDPSSVVVTYTYNTVATSDGSIGSCPYQGATPPTNVCKADGGIKSVYEWEISGTAEYEIFGFSTQYGAQEDISATCSGSTTINSWCSCCHERSRLKYKNTYKCGDCWCISLFCITAQTHCGTNKEFQQVVCDDQPACSPPSPCNPNCPPAG